MKRYIPGGVSTRKVLKHAPRKPWRPDPVQPNDSMPAGELRALRALLSPPGTTMSWEDFGRLFGKSGRTVRRYARGEAPVPYLVADKARQYKIELARRAADELTD